MSNSTTQGARMTSRSPHQQQQPTKAKSQGKQFKKIADLDYVTMKKLAGRLDIPGERNWRRLIEMMPSCRYDPLTVEKFGLNASKLDGSPAYALLSDMSSRGVSYDQLIVALKKMQFDTALQDIGYRESVKLTQQPEATPGVEGQQLLLECRATGVPVPNFLWFKAPNTPLPDQTADSLVIPRLSKEDGGKYCCRAENEVNIVFSAWVEVKVQKPHILKNESLPPGSITESPTILVQSPSEVKVQVGEELRLFVEATCVAGGHLYYQWFRAGKKLNYGTSSELLVKHARLEDQGTYSCSVRSEHGGSSLTDDSQVIVIDPNQPRAVNVSSQVSPSLNPSLVSPGAPILPQHNNQHTQIPSPLTSTTIHAAALSPNHSSQQPPQYSIATPLPPEQRIMQVPMQQEHYPPRHSNATPEYPCPPDNVAYREFENPHVNVGQPPPRDWQPQYEPRYEPYIEYGDQRFPAANGVRPGIYNATEVGGMSPLQNPNMEYPVYPDIQQPNTRAPIGTGGQMVEVDALAPQGQDQPPDLNDSCYDKVALLIGNKHYQRGDLKLNTPENDAQDMAGVLLSAGFKVVSLVNLNKTEMETAVKYFESLLGKNVYALFFFAGHGFELNSRNYMMPVDADVEKNPDQCLCAQQVLQTMQAKGSKLSIVLLDMCRVNASTDSLPSRFDPFPSPQETSGYFVIGFSCSPMERAYEAGAGPELKEEERDNSIFVSAFKRHLQYGSLRERLDTLLTDAAAGVRERGKAFNTPSNSWQKPEIRHNLGEKLSLADPIKNDYELDTQRKERSLLWQSAHIVPDSVVVGCLGNSSGNVKPGEVALRLHFEAEHSNVLIVTAELLNGCLTTCEVIAMEMSLHPCDEVTGISLLSLKCHEDNKQYKYKEDTEYGYGHYQAAKEMDLMHFKIPDLQKITTSSVALKVITKYVIERRGKFRDQRSCKVIYKMTPPLYAKILSKVEQTPSTSPFVQPYFHRSHHQ